MFSFKLRSRSSVVRRRETGDGRLFLFILPTPHTPHPTPHTPHPTPHTPHPTPYTLHPISPMIDRATVEKIAHLARLEITNAEEEQFAGQLSGILDYFEQLSELDTENVPPTTRAIEIQNITRADSNRLYRDHEVLVQESPVPEGDYFRVPRILNSDEE
ncbi:Aspartyl-tRNA(Asn) amidotransferase subunit C [Microcystis aeruginosa NIES-98]|nr:Aspartyl-tRNA(Asn) amidotransferase subunit C [Microcystis aeruginosa NIES-98]